MPIAAIVASNSSLIEKSRAGRRRGRRRSRLRRRSPSSRPRQGRRRRRSRAACPSRSTGLPARGAGRTSAAGRSGCAARRRSRDGTRSSRARSNGRTTRPQSSRSRSSSATDQRVGQRDRLLERMKAVAERRLEVDEPTDAVRSRGLDDVGRADAFVRASSSQASGSLYDAAAWTTTSGWNSREEPVDERRRRRSCPRRARAVAWSGRLSRRAVAKLSITSTESPRSSRRSARCEPMKPAPPVMSTFVTEPPRAMWSPDGSRRPCAGPPGRADAGAAPRSPGWRAPS